MTYTGKCAGFEPEDPDDFLDDMCRCEHVQDEHDPDTGYCTICEKG